MTVLIKSLVIDVWIIFKIRKDFFINLRLLTPQTGALIQEGLMPFFIEFLMVETG